MFKKEFNTEPECRAYKKELHFEYVVVFEGYAHSVEKRKVKYFLIYKRTYDKSTD